MQDSRRDADYDTRDAYAPLSKTELDALTLPNLAYLLQPSLTSVQFFFRFEFRGSLSASWSLFSSVQPPAGISAFTIFGFLDLGQELRPPDQRC
jgi:hypothetical protein